MGTKNTKKQKSKGLGDTVEKVFKATGVDKVAKWVLGEDCGCDERKEFLGSTLFRKGEGSELARRNKRSVLLVPILLIVYCEFTFLELASQEESSSYSNQLGS